MLGWITFGQRGIRATLPTGIPWVYLSYIPSIIKYASLQVDLSSLPLCCHLWLEKATIAVGRTIAILSPTDASVKDLCKGGFQARTFQGFQLRPEPAELLVIDEASMLSIPQMLWLVKHARENDSRVLLVGDSAQHRSVERGDALRILEQSSSVRYVELLQTQRQMVPTLKAAIEDLKTGRLENQRYCRVKRDYRHRLVLHDGRRMRRDGARIDQGVCITSHASQCRTVDQVVVLPDGADAKGWYVSLSRARDAMHVYTRNKLELRQSVMQPSERKSVWERLQAFQSSKPQRRDRKMPDLWAARQAEISHDVEMER